MQKTFATTPLAFQTAQTKNGKRPQSATSKKTKSGNEAPKKKSGRPTTAKPQKSGRNGKTPNGAKNYPGLPGSPSRKKGLSIKERACVAENNYLKSQVLALQRMIEEEREQLKKERDIREAMS